MKVRALIALVALVLPAFAATPGGSAREGEQSAHGSFSFTLGDRRTKYVEFDARTLAGGGAAGGMFFSDESELTYQDTDGVGDPVGTHNGFYLRAEFDSLLVAGNLAVMSGTVGDSSVRDLVGQRVLLTVEDNGENTREPDRLTWGVYRPAAAWETSDAELERDPGAGTSWHATDAERDDDEGVRVPVDPPINTRTFPLAAYAFVETADGVGDLVVRP